MCYVFIMTLVEKSNVITMTTQQKMAASSFLLLQPSSQVTVTSSGRAVKRRIQQLDDDPDQEVPVMESLLVETDMLKHYRLGVISHISLIHSAWRGGPRVFSVYIMTISNKTVHADLMTTVNRTFSCT